MSPSDGKPRRARTFHGPACFLAFFILVLGLALASYLLYFLNQKAEETENTAFDGASEGVAAALSAEASLSQTSIELVAGLFRAGFNVTLPQFVSFTAPVIERGTVPIVYYAKVISNAERNATIDAMYTLYNSSTLLPPTIAVIEERIGEVPPLERVDDVTNRTSYTVVELVSPTSGQNVAAVLVNLNSTFTNAPQVATDTAQTSTTDLLRIPFDGSLAFGIQFFSAIFDSEDPTGMSLTLQERRNTVSGFAMGLFSIPLLVDKAFIAEVTRDYSIFVYIELPDGSPKLAHVILPGGRSVNVYVSNEIFGIPLPERDLSKHSFTRQVNVLDQTWELVFVKDAVSSYDSAAIVVFILVVLFTFVAVFLVYMYVRMHKLAETTANLLAHLSVLYEGAPVGMAYVGRDRKFHNINQQAAALNGADAPEHIGKDMTEVGQGPFSEVTRERVEYVLTTGERISDAELIVPQDTLLRHRRRLSQRSASGLKNVGFREGENGIEMDVIAGELECNRATDVLSTEKSTYLMSFYPVYLHTYAPGSRTEMPLPDGVSVVVKDVTDLSKERDTANDLSLSKTLFLARMSHEIRTPIGGILGCIELLMDGSMETLSAEQESLVMIIRHSAKVLMALINDILDLSKMEADHVTLEKLPMMLVDQVLSSIDMCKVEKGVELAAFVEPGTETVSVLGDATRIAQIVYNIASNALKFTPSGHVFVRLSSRRSETESDVIVYTIRVEDTGIGIAKEKLSSVFDAFVQEKEANNRAHGGVGLGLSIVSRLVKLMDGEVGIESEPGEGTVMTVTLPMHIAKRKGTMTIQDPEDDEPREVERRYRSDGSLGFELFGASDGAMVSDFARLTHLAMTIIRDKTVLLGIKESAHMDAMKRYFLDEASAAVVDCANSAEQLFECIASRGATYRLVVLDTDFVAEYTEFLADRPSLPPASDGTPAPEYPALCRQAFSSNATLFWKAHPQARRVIKKVLVSSGFDSVLSHPSELVPSYILRRVAQISDEDEKVSVSSGTSIGASSVASGLSRRRGRYDVRPPVVNPHFTEIAQSPQPSKHGRPSIASELLARALEAPPTVTLTSAASATKTSRVLFVEDNIVNQRVIVAMLRKLLPTSEFIIAENGEIGVQRFREAFEAQQSFQVIFMDVQMPVMDGVEATKLIREFEATKELRRAPVIALTAHAMVSDRNACLIAGMDDYITKPTSMEALERVLKYFGIEVMDTAARDKEKKKLKKKRKSSHQNLPRPSSPCPTPTIALVSSSTTSMSVPNLSTRPTSSFMDSASVNSDQQLLPPTSDCTSFFLDVEDDMEDSTMV